MAVQEATLAIANRLLRELPAEEVWLFGSQARGDAGPDSEVEAFLVEHGFKSPSRHNEQWLAGELIQADYLFAR